MGAHSRAIALIRSPTQSDPPRIATIATAAGKLTRTNRRKPRLARSMSGTSRAAIPSATTNQARL